MAHPESPSVTATHLGQQQALILLAHGARDPLWAAPFERLREAVMHRLPAPMPVRLAFLEIMSPRLDEAAQALVQAGSTAICIVPVFLGTGGHVQRDVPRTVAALADRFPACTFEVAAPIGESDRVLDAMAAVCLEQLGVRGTKVSG